MEQSSGASGGSEFDGQVPFTSFSPWAAHREESEPNSEITPPGDEPSEAVFEHNPVPEQPEIVPPAADVERPRLASEDVIRLPQVVPRSIEVVGPGSLRAYEIREQTLARSIQFREADSVEARDAVWHEFGHLHNEQGVDMVRAYAFMRALGLETNAGLLIMSGNDHREFLRTMQERGFGLDTGGAPAAYEAELHTALIDRDRITSDQLSATVVHELGGHATTQLVNASSALVIKHLERTYALKPLPLLGLADVDMETGEVTGRFLNEGRAEWIALEHRRAAGQIPKEWPQNIFGIKYADHQTAYTPAATAFDILFAKDPGLIEPVLQSGKNIAATQEVIARINTIRPELYRDLAALQLNNVETPLNRDADMRSFTRGLYMVLEATGFSEADIRPIANSGPGAQYVADKLREQERVEGRSLDWYSGGRP